MPKSFNRVLVILCFVSGSSFAQSPWIHEHNNDFSLSYPADWNYSADGEMETLCLIMTNRSDSTDNFTENVNLMMQDLSFYKMDLDEFVEVTEKQIPLLFEHGLIMNSMRHTSKDGEYHQLEYAGNQGGYNLHFLAYIWVKQDRAYFATLTCEVETYDDYIEIGEQILASFRIY